MINKIKAILDKDILNTFTNYLVKLLLNPFIMLIIPLLLSPDTQGYWYAFSSIAAITVMVDAGFTQLITQFAAHEFAYLTWENNQIIGDNERSSRLLSIFRFSIKWSFSAILISIPFIYLYGYFTFHAKTDINIWNLQWILYLIAISLNFILNVIFSFFEGCKLIYKIQRIKMLNALVQTILTIVFLFLGFKLFSLALSVLITSLFSFFQILPHINGFNSSLKGMGTSSFNWRKEFLPLFKKYLASWIGGYFSLNLFVVLAFNVVNAEFAGKVGISISMVTAIFSVSNIWIYVNMPRMNYLSSQKKWKEMTLMFYKGLKLSSLTYLFLSISFLCTLLIFRELEYINRLIQFESFIILIMSWFLQLIINSFAVYLRSFKEEPFVLLSIISGFTVPISTFIILKYINSKFMFLGFLLNFIWVLPLVWKYFVVKNKQLEREYN